MLQWRHKLEDYVGFHSGTVDPTPAPGSADPDGWGWLADAYVSDYLNRWNEAKNDPHINGANLLKWATTALTYAGGSDLAKFTQGLLYRAQNNRSGALSVFQELANSTNALPRYYAQYANELINKAISTTPINNNLLLTALNNAQMRLITLVVGNYRWASSTGYLGEHISF
jgi:hypothetical protein